MKHLVLVCLAFVTQMLGVTPARSAPPEITVSDVSVTTSSGGIHLTVSLHFNKVVSTQVARRVRSQLAAGSMAQNTTAAKMINSAPKVTFIDCNHHYMFTDSVGMYHIQQACGATAAPWGFRLSAALQSIVNGSVSERGLDWKINGRQMSRMAPHPFEWKGYVFHGTYRGVRSMYTVIYQDVLSFRHNIGPGGRVTVTISGDHTFTQARYSACSPGSPCRYG